MTLGEWNPPTVEAVFLLTQQNSQSGAQLRASGFLFSADYRLAAGGFQPNQVSGAFRVLGW